MHRVHRRIRPAVLVVLAAPSLLRADDVTVELPSPDKGFRITNSYEPTDFRVELTVNWRQPGSVLDTVGINAAPVGSFTLLVEADGKVAVQIYDPGRDGPLRQASGWHRLVHPAPTSQGNDHTVVLQLRRQQLLLEVDRAAASGPCATPLSGQPVFLGDFKGDETWGDRYHIHGGMVGTVTLRYFGSSKEAASPTPAAPTTTPPATTPPAPPPSSGATAVLDQTGRLTQADVAQLGAALARFREQRGFGLGLVLSNGAPEAGGAQAKAQYNAWRADGTLPQACAVFLLAGNHFYWHYQSDVAALMTFEQVKAAWLPVANQPPAAALATFVATLTGDTAPPNPPPGPTTGATTPPAPHPPAGDEPAGLGERTGQLEAALRAGDVAKALPFLFPDLRSSCEQIFRRQPEAMAALAKLLATRRYTAQSGDVAEYQVTDGDRRYSLVFLRRDGQWLLAEF